MKSERFGLLDDLRGFALFLMIFYHGAFNLLYFAQVDSLWLERAMDSTGMHIAQLVFSSLFLLIAGICTRFSRQPYRRALRVGIAALLLTAATFVVLREDLIIFGILHCIALCILLYALTKRLFLHCPPIWGIVLSLLAFVVLYNLPDGAIFAYKLPHALYRSPLLIPLGLPPHTFSSLDYYPLIPYFFIFLCGTFIGRLSLPNIPSRSRFFSFMGRHSLEIYLLHQPVLFGLLYLILG